MSPLAGRVTSVTFHSPIKVAFGKIPVLPPHWEESLRNDLPAEGSPRPAVLSTEAPAAATIGVMVEDTDGLAGEAFLQARVGGLTLRGSMQMEAGPQSVDVAVLGIGSRLERHAGDAVWFIESPTLAAPAPLGEPTRLEVFLTFGPPSAFFQTNGVWAEALSLLLGGVVNGMDDPQEVVRRVTRYCHEEHGLKYDVVAGRQSFGASDLGGTFNLSNFLAKAFSQVNCFDCLAAVHVLSGAVGVSTTWLTMPSFGFIREAKLVGIGACNNPFFGKNSSPQIIDSKNQNRTSFGIHGFCERSNRIFDACLGPQSGTDDRENYLKAVVDEENHLNEKIPTLLFMEPRPGSPPRSVQSVV